MTKANNGIFEVFTEVVAAEAWHAPFADGVKVAHLSVDVVFGSGRLGEEAASAVRFRLTLKAAEVVVIVPASEPVVVDPASVSRDTPRIVGKKTASKERASKRNISGGFFAKLGFNGFSGGGSGKVGVERASSDVEKIESASDVESFSITQSRSDDGHHRWLLTAQIEEAMSGRPWDPVKQPRLALVDQRPEGGGSLPPSVRVEVRCRREDLIISDLQIKNEQNNSKLTARKGAENRLAAAESYIRDRLIENGLETPDLQEAFSRLTLASVPAIPQVVL